MYVALNRPGIKVWPVPSMTLFSDGTELESLVPFRTDSMSPEVESKSTAELGCMDQPSKRVTEWISFRPMAGIYRIGGILVVLNWPR